MVVNAPSPLDFCILTDEHYARFLELSKLLNKDYLSYSGSYRPQEREELVILRSLDDGMYYRGELLEEVAGQYRLMLVDVGAVETLPATSLAPMPQK